MRVVNASMSSLSELNSRTVISEKLCLIDGYSAIDIDTNEKYFVVSKNSEDFNYKLVSRLKMDEECVIKISPLVLSEYNLGEKKQILRKAKNVARNIGKRR